MIKASFRVFAALLTMIAVTATANAQSGYTIRSGDTLQIEVLEDASLNRDALVLPGGSISFPFAGTVPAAGRTVGDVASDLAGRLASNFAATPNVFVSVAQVGVPTGVYVAPTTDIYVTGEITNPGKLEGARGITILQAIAQGGGLTRFAAGKRIQLRRGDKIYPYNYETNGGSGSIPGSTVLAPGDVIVVPQRTLFE
jgi:polysaccharide biosynthesis/export protein